jgi:hypothetical protein
MMAGIEVGAGVASVVGDNLRFPQTRACSSLRTYWAWLGTSWVGVVEVEVDVNRNNMVERGKERCYERSNDRVVRTAADYLFVVWLVFRCHHFLLH